MMLIAATITSFGIVIVEWVVVCFKDVNRSDPEKESHFVDAFKSRLNNVLTDAKYNWFPFNIFFRFDLNR